jgi:hypothetical protein
MNGIDEQFFGELAKLQLAKETYDNYINSNIRNTYEWVTKNNQHIKLSLIEDSHLNNIIKMVEKKQNEYTKLLRILKLEKSYREHYDKTVKLIKEYHKIADIIF